MPIFQFEIPTNFSEFILYIWHCLGKEAPSIPDLKFFLSYRAKLMPPSKAQDVIDKALHEGLLVNKNNILQLSDALQIRQMEQDQKEKERIQQHLEQQSRKEKALASRGFNDYFREVLPEEYKTKTFLIKLKDIKIESVGENSRILRALISSENAPNCEVHIDGISSKLSHTCDLFTPQYRSNRKFCPHIGAIFRAIQKESAELALELIRSIVENKEKWDFSN